VSTHNKKIKKNIYIEERKNIKKSLSKKSEKQILHLLYRKTLQKNKKNIYIEERKNIKKSLSKKSEKLRADRITTLGGSGVHSSFFFLKRIFFSFL